MGLKDLRFPEATIETGGGPLTVHHLSLMEILRLVKNHGAPLAALFAKVMDKGEAGLDLADVQAYSTVLLSSAPRCAAEIIALAAREADEEGIAAALALPAPAQIEALDKIATMTFSAGGGPKKVVEAVIRALAGWNHLAADLKSPT